MLRDKLLTRFLLASVPIFFGMLSVRLGQDINFDLLNYHLYIAYAYLNNRINFDLAPSGFQTYLNPFVDIAYYFAVTHWKPKVAAFVLGTLQGLNFVVLYGVCVSALRTDSSFVKRSWLPLFLAACGVLSVGFLSEVGRTFHDSLLALFPLLSLWAILYSMPRLANNGKFFSVIALAGLSAGVGSGFKLINGMFALSLFFSLMTIPARRGNRLKYMIVFGAAVVIGFLVSDGYWLYRMWYEFGNPVFPAFNQIFHGKLATFENGIDAVFLPKTILEKICYPIIFTLNPLRVGELKYQQVSWLVAYVLLVAYLLSLPFANVQRANFRQRLPIEGRFLLVYMVLAYILWQKLFGVYRYLVPIEILLPLAIFFLVTRLLPESRWAPKLTLFLIGIITMVNLPGIPEWGRRQWDEKIFHMDARQVVKRNPSVVLLGGQPLGWIAPALNMKLPFVQVVPNFSVSKNYWKRASEILYEHGGRFVLILRSESQFLDAANEGLANLGLRVNAASCEPLEIYIAKDLIVYKICDVEWQS